MKMEVWCLVSRITFVLVSTSFGVESLENSETFSSIRPISDKQKGQFNNVHYGDLVHPFENIDDSSFKNVVNELSNDTSSKSEERELQGIFFNEDFQGLNQFLYSSSIYLPDNTYEKTPFEATTITTRNLFCNEIFLRDLDHDFRLVTLNEGVSTFEVVVGGISTECYFDWTYIKANGSIDNGIATVKVRRSTARVMFNINSESLTGNALDEVYPISSSPNSCRVEINIRDLKLRGSFFANLANLFEPFLKIGITNQLEDGLCQDINKAITGSLSNALLETSTYLTPYLSTTGDMVKENVDPLSGESNLKNLNEVAVLDFSDENDIIVKAFNKSMERIHTMFGTEAYDPNKNGTDLGINTFLRSSFLDENGKLILDRDIFSKIARGTSANSNEVRMEVTDTMFNVSVTLTEMGVFGLDSLSVFSPLKTISSHTFQNHFHWDFLMAEFNFTVEMYSTADSLSLQNNAPDEIQIVIPPTVEHSTIKFGISDIDTMFSFMAALDVDLIGGLELFNILSTSHIAPCMRSITYGFDVTQLDISIGKFLSPWLENFIDKGVEDVVSSLSKAVADLYGDAFQSIIPNFVATTAREYFNRINDEILSDPEKAECPNFSGLNTDRVAQFIDFRDLLLNSTDAAAVGASGEEPYGSLASTLFSAITTFLTEPDNNGSPNINTAIIKPITEMQSSIPGTLNIVEDELNLFDLSILGLESISLSIADARIENLDSFGYPLKLLMPSFGTSDMLRNIITVGVGENPFRIASKLILSLKGDNFDVHNEIDLSLSVEDAVVLANIVAKVKEEALMGYPLIEVGNPFCWLTTILAPEFDTNGLPIDNANYPPAKIEDFSINANDLSLEATCSNCSSTGLEELPDILSIMEVVGTVDILSQSMMTLVDDIVSGDYMQNVIDNTLRTGEENCAFSPNYTGSGAKKRNPFNGSVLSTKGSYEQIVFIGITMIQSLAIVTAMTERDDKTYEDPLLGQHLLDTSSTQSLVNYNAVETKMEDIVSKIFKIVNIDLNKMINEPKESFLHAFLHSTILDRDKGYTFETKNISFSIFTLESVRVHGLNSLNRIDPITPIAPQTIQTGFAIDRMAVELNVAIDTSSTTTRSVPGEKIARDGIDDTRENMTVTLRMQDIEASASLLLGLDEGKLGDINLGSMLNSKQIMPCLLSGIAATNVTQVLFSVGNADEMEISGFLSDDLKSAISNLWGALSAVYGNKLINSIPALFASVAPGVLNSVMNQYLSNEANVECPTHDVDNIDGPEYIDFRDLFLNATTAAGLGASGTEPYGDLASKLMEMISSFISDPDETGSPNINSVFIEPFTKAQSNFSGTLKFPGELFQTTHLLNDTVNADDVLSFSIFDFQIENLDSFGYPIEVLQPNTWDPYVLDSHSVIGFGSEPLRFKTRILISVQGDNSNLYDKFDVVLELSKASFLASIFSRLEKSRFLSFPIRDVKNFHCWLSIMLPPKLNEIGVRVENVDSSAGLTNLDFDVEKLHSSIECISCTGYQLEVLGTSLSSEAGKRNSTILANYLLDTLEDFLLSEMFQSRIDRLIVEAESQCPTYGDTSGVDNVYLPFETPLVDSNSAQITLGLAVFLIVVFVAMLASSYCTKRVIHRKHKESLENLSEDEINNLISEQKQIEGKEIELCRATKSMMYSTEIPSYVRFGMPIVILMNIALFMSGHLNLGATLKVDLRLAGDLIVIQDFFEFSIAESIRDMWNIQLYSLAVIIFGCSVLWPYTKQCILLILWTAPPSRISVSRRTTWFLKLDNLGKWSMTDIYVLIMVLVVFQISVHNAQDSMILPEGFLGLDLMLVPLWGLYANMIAQIISQISSHFIIHYQRKIISNGLKRCGLNNPNEENTNEYQVALSQHKFQIRGRNNRSFAKVRFSSTTMIAFLLSFTTFLLILGCSVTSFRLEILGAARKLVEFSNGFDPAITEYSIFSIVGVMMREAAYLNTVSAYVGLAALSLLLLMTSLIVPCLHSISLLILWMCGMKKWKKNKLVILIEILRAWQYVEVYIIASFLGMWQIGDISDTLVGPICSPLEPTFASLAHFGILSEENARCFYADAQMEVGAYVLLLACVLLGWLSNFVLEAEKQRSEEAFGIEEMKNFDVLQENMMDLSLDSEDFDLLDKPDTRKLKKCLKPLPAKFTDSFKWFLIFSHQAVKTDLNVTALTTEMDLSMFLKKNSPRSKEEAAAYQDPNATKGSEITKQFRKFNHEENVTDHNSQQILHEHKSEVIRNGLDVCRGVNIKEFLENPQNATKITSETNRQNVDKNTSKTQHDSTNLRFLD